MCIKNEVELSMPRPAQITGYLLPVQENGEPWLVEMPNNSARWIPIFSIIEKLEEACAFLNIKNYNVKKIHNGLHFVESLAENGIRIMLDPFVLQSEQKTRWTEIRPS